MNTFREKAVAACPDLYVNLVTIIQGLALTAFAETLDFSFTHPVQFIGRIAMYAVIAQMIVITWHEYVMSSLCFAWPLDWLDAAIPIILGLSEFVAIGFTKLDTKSEVFGVQLTIEQRLQWFCVALTVFVGVALLAFLNRERKAREAPENKEAWACLGKSITETRNWLIRSFVGYGVGVFVILSLSKIWIAIAFLALANATFAWHGVLCAGTYRLVFRTPKPCDDTNSLQKPLET